jgi:uncharacterized protein (TIGR03086 family)
MTQSAPNPIEVYEGAAQMMQPIMAGVASSQLTSSTPCTEWNVQQLIQHNLKVSQWAHGILTGASSVNPMDVSGELPREGAAAAFEAIANGLLATAKSRDLEEVVEGPFGPMTVGQLLIVPSGDIVVHKWDLAKATDQDTSLDSGLAEVCFHAILAVASGGREQGFFGPEVNVPANATIQEKLLAVTGRQP